MQNGSSPRSRRQATDDTPAARAGATAPARRIDCGAVTDDSTPRLRQERADARHAYLTASGTYAEQVQAL